MFVDPACVDLPKGGYVKTELHIRLSSIAILFAAVNVAVIADRNEASNISLKSLLNMDHAVAEYGMWDEGCTSWESVTEDILEPCSDGSGYYTYSETYVNCNYNGSGPCADGISISWSDCTGRSGGCAPGLVWCS